uniref:Uncharacterized protein n=1 Tax=Salix viminalis TaxID=40686 RepID=A0A6N2K519_SALVM
MGYMDMDQILIVETGVGWSYELAIIAASDEWWNSKIQEIRRAKKFRQSVGANEFDLGTSNVGLEDADLEEGSGDSEENVNKDFENHISRGVEGVHMSSSSNTKSTTTSQHSMSNRSDSTSANRDLSGCSIREVMVEFQSIPGSTDDGEFFDLATAFLSLRRNRELWASITSIERKYSWLQRNIARQKNVELQCSEFLGAKRQVVRPMFDGIRVEHVGSDHLAKQQSHLRRNPNYLTTLMSCHGKG